MSGIVAYGAYLPYWRMQRSAIAGVLGSVAGRGTRSVASYDEDATSMAVEAGRIGLRAAGSSYRPESVWFATTTPGYLDKSNSTTVHAALGLPSSVGAFDAIGGIRSGLGAAAAASAHGAMAILSDVRTGRPGSAEEASGGDAAVALCFGDVDPIAVIVGRYQAIGEFTDRWRVPGEDYSRVWEDRFGEYAGLPLAQEAVTAALKESGWDPEDLDHIIVTGLHARAVKAAPKACGLDPSKVVDDLVDRIGNTGAAHWGLLLTDVLDRATPGQKIAVVVLTDGAEVSLWETTSALSAYQQRSTSSLRAAIAAGREDLEYASFLTWRGYLQREPPRRPEPDRPASPPSLRTTDWKYGLVGSRDETGFVHLPPARVSMGTGKIDQMEPVRMADVPARIATFTVDRLAYSLSPPVVAAIIDFDGGGRFQCELTDVDPEAVRIGGRVEMTFRRLYTTDGIHNYFWKARPTAAE
jgi:hydroxymethylglutaryl-CoA synthase